MLRRLYRRYPVGADVLLGCLVAFFFTFVTRRFPEEETSSSLGLIDLVAGAATVAVISVRRRWPGRLLVLGSLVAVAGLPVRPLIMVVLIVLAYTTAVTAERRTTWPLIGFAALVQIGSLVLFGGEGLFEARILGVIAWMGLAGAAGDAIRNRRAYLAAVEERARRAEQTREQEAERRVLAERMRIARELHDVVAHHIAVISVQAGVASHAATRGPEHLQPALTHIRRSCDEVLGELASVVGLLRRGEGPGPATEPVPGLAELPRLIEDSTATGLTVELEQEGRARELPAMSDLAAYRIAQEALTNARKYGSGPVRLRVCWSPGSLRLVVRNQVRDAGESTGSGFGIMGMRERAQAAGGALSAGAGPTGDFEVVADLPLPEPDGVTGCR